MRQTNVVGLVQETHFCCSRSCCCQVNTTTTQAPNSATGRGYHSSTYCVLYIIKSGGCTRAKRFAQSLGSQYSRGTFLNPTLNSSSIHVLVLL